MVRKVFRSGNSFVVALPPEVLSQLALSEGSELDVAIDSVNNRVLLTPVRPGDSQISPEYARQVADFIATYRPALEALARR
jgi:putative addiction module antidote